MRISDFEIHSTDKLDAIVAKCCDLTLDKNANDRDYWGMVGACVLDPQNRAVYGVNHVVDSEGNRDHAEVAAIKNYIKRYGPVPRGSILITTLSPCSTDTDQPDGRNCTDYIEQHGIHKVYCGYEDPNQIDNEVHKHKQFHTMESRNPKLRALCRAMADTFLET